MQVHHFDLDFLPGHGFARFPFIVDGLPLSGMTCVVSHREAGDMGYTEHADNPNRERFFAALGIDSRRVHARSQTHSRDVSVAGEDDRPGDGLVSIDPDKVLSVTVADCLPVFLLDTDRKAVAVLHSGWKGTGIVNVALSLMGERWGTRPESVAAVLGPCIRSCCYGVDAERAAVFEAEFGGAGGRGAEAFPLGPVVRRDADRAFIDLQAANAHLLHVAGVRNIAVCRNCTYTDERLGSFRREGAGRFTRMIAVAGRLNEETL